MSKGRAKKAKKMKCVFCGALFTALKRNARHCEACRADIKRADARAQYRIKTGKLAREDYRAAVEAGVRAAVEERRRREAANRPRCPYCGNVHGVDSSGYCASCRRLGFDGLHMATGRTNGWDRPAKPPRARAVGGWRGRPVAGCSKSRRMDGMMEVLACP